MRNRVYARILFTMGSIFVAGRLLLGLVNARLLETTVVLGVGLILGGIVVVTRSRGSA